MSGPLDGVKILEFSEIIAGPFGGMLLADMGADIIKIEPTWGEPWRFTQQLAPGESRTYMSLNRGKRSLPLNLTKPEARDIIYQLIPQMDVVITNYRPDTPYKLGFDYETLSAINSRLIYCETTAYGTRGPDSARPGYDIIAQALSGLMAAEGKIVNGLPQQIQSTAPADFSTGIAIAWGISAALYARETTGRGQKIETTLLATAMGLQTNALFSVRSTDQESRSELIDEIALLRESGASWDELDQFIKSRRPRPIGNIYYRTYHTKDSVIAVGCLSDPIRKRMAATIGVDDPRFEDGFAFLGPVEPEMQAILEDLTNTAEGILREKTTHEWLSIFDQAGVPAGPIKYPIELPSSEQVQANEMMVQLEHPLLGTVEMQGPMIRMLDTPLEAKHPSPTLGQHTDEILLQLGYTPDAIKRLRASETIK